MIEFRYDDESYLTWVEENPFGFVLNVRMFRDPSYVVLHRASCGCISSAKQAPGAFTERGYRKICASTVDELKEAAKREGRRNGSFSKRCGMCRA